MEALIGFAVLLLLLFLRVQVGIAFAVVGIVGLYSLVGIRGTSSSVLTTLWSTSTSYTLMTIPLFTLMGQLAGSSSIGTGLYKAGTRWFGRMPGGMAIGTTWGSALLGAVTGQSQTGVTTFLPIAYKPMVELGYDKRLALGSIVAGGTMGAMIPPSTSFIIYGIITDTSIGQLFMAGVIPGLLEAVLYSITIYVISKTGFWKGPPGQRFSWRDKITALQGVWGMLLLFVSVIGGIYLGWFTPTEAGAVGALGAFILLLLDKGFDWPLIRAALIQTIHITCMVFVIIIGALIFMRFMAVAGLAGDLKDWLETTLLNRWVVLAIFLLGFFVLGTVMPAMPMILLTIPIAFPVFVGVYEFHPVWFGVLVVLMSELAFITPPVGFNLYVGLGVLRGMAARGLAENVPDVVMFRAVIPFVLADLVRLLLVLLFPALALWLPEQMFN
jgi:C4-dicarboxylate transporter DctM subunit